MCPFYPLLFKAKIRYILIMKKIRVGFAGLGLMGNPMAQNIAKAGFPLMVFNRTPEKTKEFQKAGIDTASSPAELSGKVDVVITMVTGPKDVEEILFGPDGVTKTAKQGLAVVDMSTIGPSAAVKISQRLKRQTRTN